MASVLDFTPDYVNITGYAGDTMRVCIQTNPPTYTDSGIWSAQVRNSPGSAEILEFFSISPIAGGACLELTSQQTADLAAMGAIKRAKGCAVYQVFTGAWDVQVLWTADACVQTLARGSFSVTMDVTR